jgi:hypothetical protein
MDPVFVNPNFPAIEAVEQLRASLACVADAAESANRVMRRGTNLFDRMLGFTEPPGDVWGRLYDLEVQKVVIKGRFLGEVSVRREATI